jgi:hypothetical protein
LRISQKKKKKTAPSSQVPPENGASTDVPSVPPPARTDPLQSKKDKKARQKAKKAEEAADDGKDEVDRALAELSLKSVLLPVIYMSSPTKH